MPYYKKPRFISLYVLPGLLVCVLVLIMPSILYAQAIMVEHASTNLVEDDYYVSARIDFNFDDEVLNALRHGIGLNVDVFIRIKRDRKWLWNPVVYESKLQYKLEHHPLSNLYVVTDITANSRFQFQSLEDATLFLGDINNHKTVSKDYLDKDSDYFGFIMAKLNIETLPPPLQPIAQISSKWQLESKWYEWVIR